MSDLSSIPWPCKAGEKDKELEYFHKDIAKKEISIACSECHSLDGIMDYEKLGFDEKKARQLKTINIKGLITKYDIFYLPQMLYH
ncbi:MAG TPA: hypothetical protein ENG75_04335 [Nitrospirae bacterium]|nr:hypothetical protein [Nitrospirota bacterium]